MKIKKLPLILAAICSVSLLVSCKPEDDEAVQSMSELVPNVITQSEADTVTTPPITDSEGNTNPSLETKSPEELQSELEAQMTAQLSQTAKTSVMTQPANAIKSKDRYAYNTLTDYEKSLYDAIVENVSSLSVNVPNTLLVDVEVWNKIYGMVYNQEPQLFWMSPSLRGFGGVGSLYYRTRDPEAIKKMQGEIDKTVNKLLADMAGMSTFDKLDYINTYLAANSTFLKAAETDSDKLFNGSIYNAFAGGTAKQGDLQCSGYAHAVQYLCDLSGIESMFITGTTDTGLSHAWNIVKVEGNWYNFDTTWSDPVLETANYKNINHMYILVPDKWILNKSHFNQNKVIYSDGSEILYFTPPACTSDAMNWFIQKGEVYSDAASAKAEIERQLDNAAKNGLRTTEIMCSSKTVYDAVLKDAVAMQNALKAKYSNVRALSIKSNPNMYVIELDVLY
jgi:transglutaminase/protease-like cytokinesis protein 3